MTLVNPLPAALFPGFLYGKVGIDFLAWPSNHPGIKLVMSYLVNNHVQFQVNEGEEEQDVGANEQGVFKSYELIQSNEHQTGAIMFE